VAALAEVMLTPHACARHLEQRLKRRFRKQEKAVCPCENARDAAKKGFKACGIRARFRIKPFFKGCGMITCWYDHM